MSILRKHLRNLFRSERGAATVEFVIVFPFFVGVFLSSFDVAMMNLRAVMLERATDQVVRAIRLSSGANLSYDVVKDDICGLAYMIPDCDNTLRIQLQPVDMTTWTGVTGTADCVDRDNPMQPLVKFENGQQNELMLIRVCAIVDPFFPGIGVGRTMPKDATGGYQVTASSAFVNEPV
ncbi:MAG: pilus assembly protein [Roseovarius confluentis]